MLVISIEYSLHRRHCTGSFRSHCVLATVQRLPILIHSQLTDERTESVKISGNLKCYAAEQ